MRVGLYIIFMTQSILRSWAVFVGLELEFSHTPLSRIQIIFPGHSFQLLTVCNMEARSVKQINFRFSWDFKMAASTVLCRDVRD